MTNLGHRTTAMQAVQGRDLSGLQVILTGGNSGIGVETSRALASAGADVIVTSRSLEAGEAAAEAIRKGAKVKVAVKQLDLADVESIKAFADGVSAELPKLDVLILNAGVMAPPKKLETKDGFELQIGTNHIGHQYLTQLLLPKLKQAPAARVVSVSSAAHSMGGLDVDDLNWEQRKYSPWLAYGASKLANVLFAKELARRMAEEGSPVRAYSLHPGVIATGLGRHMTGGWLFNLMAKATTWMPMGAKTVEQGAATSVYAATAPELESHSGAYLADCAIKAPSKQAQDAELAKQLWAKTQELLDGAVKKRAGSAEAAAAQ